MSTTTVDFSNSKVRPKIKSTMLTEGLLATGEITGKHLHEAFGTDNLTNLNIGYAQIFAATDRYHGKPLVGMTEAKGKTKLIGSHGFRYELSGGAAQKARITKVINTDPYPGINNSTIDIVVDRPYFNISDVIQPEHNEYRLRVVTKDGSRAMRKLDHNEYQYTLQLTTNDPQRFLPRQFLEEGAEWCKVSSSVANEANQDFGGFQFYSIFQSEGQVQQHAVKVELSDKAARKAKKFADADFKGDSDLGRYADSIKNLWVGLGKDKLSKEPIARFMNLLDAEAFNRLYMDVENTLMFGQESNIMYSPEGHQIFTASGLREQLKSGWTLEHNGNLSLQELEDWFDSILKDKVSEGDQKIVLSAGREFRKMFDRMIKADSSSFLTLDTHFIRKGDGYRHMDYGSYFASYRGFTVDIMVMENPAYDNLYYSPQRHPVKTNVPIDSWRADILDFGYSKQQGTGGTTDNISMIAEEYCDYHITYNGKWYGAYDGKSGMPITDGGLGQAGGVSGYSIIREKSAGLMVADVTRCGSIYLSVDSNDFASTSPSAEPWYNQW
jgi:hypothetical protein